MLFLNLLFTVGFGSMFGVAYERTILTMYSMFTVRIMPI